MTKAVTHETPGSTSIPLLDTPCDHLERIRPNIVQTRQHIVKVEGQRGGEEGEEEEKEEELEGNKEGLEEEGRSGRPIANVGLQASVNPLFLSEHLINLLL